MALRDEYIDYLLYVRRYSPRTVSIYEDVLDRFTAFCADGEGDEALLGALTDVQVRNYEVHLLDDGRMKPRTVNQHLSALSGFCRYLMNRKLLSANPVKQVRRPRESRRLPQFYRDEALEKYFAETAWWAGRESLDVHRGVKGELRTDKGLRQAYMARLSRLIVSLLYATGIRRGELIALDRSSLDASRKVLHVRGKGDKMRTIPIVLSLFEEILVYLEAVDMLIDCDGGPGTPLLLTPSGGRLYPAFVDRVVKAQLGGAEGISGRLSPHVLRHSLATQLLQDGGDLNSIKELLGHSSLAATQVYTHNTVAQLAKVYQSAHPRAKKRR